MKLPKYEPLKMSDPNHAAKYGRQMKRFNRIMQNKQCLINRDRNIVNNFV